MSAKFPRGGAGPFLARSLYNHLYILLFKGAIYLISILQQACTCFHGKGKKEVNLIHVFQSIKLGGPYEVLEVCKYVIVPTTIGILFLNH